METATEPLTEQPTGLKWTAHPVMDKICPPLSGEEVKLWLGKPGGFEAVASYKRKYEARIAKAEADPLRFGFELPFWQEFRDFLARKDELYALGGNGPGKTEIGGKIVVEKLCSTRGMKVLCVTTNEDMSKQLQQAAVYKYLPAGVRGRNESGLAKKRDFALKVRYSQAGGFTEGTFVLPNRSQCWFKTVEQYERKETSFEGPEYDLVWIDEPAPVALVDTLSYRVGKRRGKFLFTFTAVHGYDAVCKRVVEGAKLLKSFPLNYEWDLAGGGNGGGPNLRIVVPELSLTEEQVKGCPPGHMPFMMQPLDPRKGLIFLWTQWNPFLPRSADDPNVPDLFNKVRGKSKATVRTRLFGWAEKISGCQFPQFDPGVHVIPAEKVPTEGTDYMSGDPAMARSYFCLWARVDRAGRMYVFDESPRMDEGEWVTADGERGDGQKVFAGLGSGWYKEHIRGREHEHGREALRRKGDPRAFATQAAAAEGGQSLFELFLQPEAKENRGPMYWEPAKVRATIGLDIERVNDFLAWDDSRELSVENEPKLYISERCQNLIRAMLNWGPNVNGVFEQDNPWKDPIDALRYLFDEQLYYMDPNVPEVVGGRGW